MIRNFYRIGAFASLILAASVLTAAGQDLGSSNKLFGGGAKKTDSAKPAESKPKSTAKKRATVAKKPAAERLAAKKTPAPKPTVAKSKGKPKASPVVASKRTTPRREVETQAVVAPPPTVIAPRNGRKTDMRERRASVASSVVDRRTTIIAKTPEVTVARETVTISNAKTSKRVDQIVERAADAYDDGDHASAENLFRRAGEVAPKDPRVYRGLSVLYERQKRWEDAELSYRETAKLDPNDTETMLRLARLLIRPVSAPNLSERYEEAEALARKVTKLSPRNAAARNLLARSLELQGETGAETEAAYRSAISLDSRDAVSNAYLGRLLRGRGREDEANRYFSDAIENADDSESRIEVATVLLGENRTKDAIEVLDRAIANDRKNVPALNLLGRALTSAGNFPEAEKTLRRSIETQGANFGAYSNLATLYMRQGNYEAAEQALNRSIPFASSFEKRRLATQFELVGDGFSKSGRAINAASAYRQARRLDPDRETLNGKIARMR